MRPGPLLSPLGLNWGPVPASVCHVKEPTPLSTTYHLEHVLHELAIIDQTLATSTELLRDAALTMAAESDRRQAANTARPLEGMPFTVKDVIDVAGARTTGGSKTRENIEPAHESAQVIQRLLHAGAIPVAKDSTSEFAIGDMHTPLKGPCSNPWDVSRWAGGSSSGTAATVATGVVPFGIGTDVNGSVRMPAAFCGVVGLKPTRGLVPSHGVMPMAWSTEVVGPLARDATTLREVFLVMRDSTPSAVPSPVPDRQLRLAVPQDDIFLDCDASVLAGLEDFLTTMQAYGTESVLTTMPEAAFAAQSTRQIVATESAYVHCHDSDLWREYTVFTQQRLQLGLSTKATDYIHAQHQSRALSRVLTAMLNDADAIVMPTVPGTAPKIADAMMTINDQEVETYLHQSRFVSLCSVTGFPAISFPTGFDHGGRPVSTMLIGAPRHEEQLIAIVETYQAHSDHHLVSPDYNRAA